MAGISRIADIIRRDSMVISQSLTREYPFVFKKAKGCHIWDIDGRKYLDFAAGVAVANIGHTNPVIKAALQRQIKDGIHCEFSDFYAEAPVVFAEELLSLIPGKDNVFLSNSGTESVEAAYKLAKWHTDKKWVIAFENAFHGRTLGSLSMTKSKPVQRRRFGPFLPVRHAPYPYFYRMDMEQEECSDYCLDKLENAIRKSKDDTAAVFMEPVQGEGGYIVPPKKFAKGVRRLCNEYGILLCADEVQTGCFRTGKFLALQNFGVEADVVSLAKGLAGGIPIGATVSEREIMDWPSGSHANTFGGNLLACAAGIAALNFMKQKKLGSNALRVGKFMMKRLQEMKEKYEIVGDVRGIGLMIGLEIVKNKKTKEPGVEESQKILQSAFSKGLILLPAGMSTIRICPPLIITKQQANSGMDILENSFRNCGYSETTITARQ